MKKIMNTIRSIDESIEKSLETISDFLRPMFEFFGELICGAAMVIGRLLVLAFYAAVVAVPFYLMDYSSTENFWYYTGAYGVYLLGVAQLIGR